VYDGALLRCDDREMKAMRWILVVVAILGCMVGVRAQEAPAAPSTAPPTALGTGQSPATPSETSQTPAANPEYTIRAGAKIVLVPAMVQEKNGQIIYGLKANQFVVEDDGVPQAVKLDEDTDQLGLSLVVLLQCSRSAMMEYSKLNDLPTMIDGLVGGAPREVALVRYGSHPELVQPFTRDMDQMAQSMSRMGPCEDDKAATVDAVSYAASILANRRDRFRHAVLLISETRDHGSSVKEQDVIAQLGKTNTVVNAVAFSPAKSELVEGAKYHGGVNPLELIVWAVQALRQNVPKTIAHLSGGEYINFTTKKGFENGLLDLSNHVHNYYLLSFVVPQGAPDGLHEIRVRVPEYPSAVIRSRESYWAGDGKPPTQ